MYLILYYFHVKIYKFFYFYPSINVWFFNISPHYNSLVLFSTTIQLKKFICVEITKLDVSVLLTKKYVVIFMQNIPFASNSRTTFSHLHQCPIFNEISIAIAKVKKKTDMRRIDPGTPIKSVNFSINYEFCVFVKSNQVFPYYREKESREIPF